jgi:fructosamine-3-kinase
MTFVKRDPGAPEDFFAAEAAGLRWLAEVPDGAVVAVPLQVDRHALTLPRLVSAAPTAAAAEAFGRALARTHRAGAPWHGCPPAGWADPGFIGPLPMTYRPRPPGEGHPAGGDVPPRSGAGEGGGTSPPAGQDDPWGRFFAEQRLAPYARTARDLGALDAAGAAAVDRVCARLADGDPELTGPAEPPSRLHGDLWSGNLLWTPSGVVLVDPSAHGGHRESDLAMLGLFGAPLLDRVLAGYRQEWPLAEGWQHRAGVHRLYPLLVHAVLFGRSYGADAARTARAL